LQDASAYSALRGGVLCLLLIVNLRHKQAFIQGWPRQFNPACKIPCTFFQAGYHVPDCGQQQARITRGRSPLRKIFDPPGKMCWI